MGLGKLERGAVLKAMCSGFQESTEPAICLTEGPILPFIMLFSVLYHRGGHCHQIRFWILQILTLMNVWKTMVGAGKTKLPT